MNEPAKRAPGRPRSDLSREALLDAAYWQARDRGYAAATAEAIAKAAGAGKQTLYRWWPSKGALVLEAMLAKLRERIDRPREAALRAGEAGKFLAADLAGLRPFADALRGLIAESYADPELALSLRTMWLDARARDLAAVLTAAAPDAPARQGLAEAIEGAILARVVFGGPLDDDFAHAMAGLAGEGGR